MSLMVHKTHTQKQIKMYYVVTSMIYRILTRTKYFDSMSASMPSGEQGAKSFSIFFQIQFLNIIH